MVRVFIPSMCLAFGLLSAACDGDTEPAPNCEETAVWEGDFMAVAPGDLEALASIARVTGDLTLTGSVRDVAQLGCLEQIDGFLYLSQGELFNLHGLGNLSNLGSLYVSQMPNLTSLEGLESVRSLGSITVQRSAVETLLGLSALEEVRGRVHLYESEFETMQGLETLRTIGGSLIVTGAEVPLSLDGLEALESIGGDLSVEQNSGLTSMSGLAKLQSIGGELSVVGNASLTELQLPMLESLGDTLRIRSNVLLPNCQALAVRDRLVNAGWMGAESIGSNGGEPCD